MQTKQKLSLTIDKDIYDALEEASRVHGLPKSQLAQKALELLFKKETDALMAKGYEDMANEDETFADVAFDAQREILE